MVFQSGALFDSLDGGGKHRLSTGERARTLTEEQKDARVAELADMLEVSPLM